MQLALLEAKKGLGRTHPNPAVGAVIVKGGKVIASGYHARAGTAHAEANALMLAGPAAKGATIYSTLEPCDHFGRTPPCTQAILDSGIRRVVYGSSDPNPLVNGKGLRRMRRAGLAVRGGVLEAECDALNAPFLKAMRTGLPYVTVKVAMTLDGKIATASGDSKWITSEVARRRAHQLRNQVDAIVVGAQTVVRDDPALTTRIPEGRHARRIILDPSLRTPLSSKVYERNGTHVLVLTAKDIRSPKASRLRAKGVDVRTLGVTARGLVLKPALEALAKEGALHLMVEGGATTISHFLRNDVVDEIVLFVAPKIIGQEGLTWSGPLSIRSVAQAREFRLDAVERWGDEVMLRFKTRR
jgi:diaminohydroxyphosphoribosylaminopyrimidine deaminase/5-amino-6-(5-phosphoribosylamino)uracil reductase